MISKVHCLALCTAWAGFSLPTRPQGFNKRYDQLGQSLQQSAWSIERCGDGLLTIGASSFVYQDSFYYDPIVYSHRLDMDGSLVQEDSLVYINHAIYPGASDCMNPIPGGGYIAGGATFSQNGTARMALWQISPIGNVALLGEYGLDGGGS